MRYVSAGLLLLLCEAGMVHAELFTIPLPGLEGTIDGKQYNFDFGRTFVSINSISVQSSGHLSPAELSPGHFAPGSIIFYIPANPGWMGVSGKYSGDFSGDSVTMKSSSHATFTDFLDGRATILAEINYYVTIPENPPIISQPSGTISSAFLTIDGVAPEPASLGLLGLGALFLARIRRPERS